MPSATSHSHTLENVWLFALVPVNAAAWEVFNINPGRTVTTKNHDGQVVQALAVYLNNMTIGRRDDCGIILPAGRRGFNRVQCTFQVSMNSGEMVIFRQSNCPSSVHLNGEMIEWPPYTAFVFGHAENLVLTDAEFEVCWPEMADQAAVNNHRLQKRLAAVALQQKTEIGGERGYDGMPVKATETAMQIGESPAPGEKGGSGPRPIKRGVVDTCDAGYVYLAMDETMTNLVIVKELSFNICPDHDIEAVASSELNRLCILSHPNIVKMHSWNRSENPLLAELVLELCPHDRLASFVGHEGWVFEHAEAIFEQLCEAVAYLHAHDVVHGDIKPQNIHVIQFPDGRVQVKLTDLRVPLMSMQDLTLNKKDDISTLAQVFVQLFGWHTSDQGRCCWLDHGSQQAGTKISDRCPIANLLRAMMAERPDDRPDAVQCLDILDGIQEGPIIDDLEGQ